MTIKPAFRKLILPLAVSASLAACGGGGGGGGGGGSSAEVSGTSSKGIIVGGIVNAYPISDTGVVDRSTPLAEPATTGDDGSYSLELNGDYEEGTAIFLEITAADGTVMKCDLVQCAEGIAFGDSYPLGSAFALSGVLPSASGDTVTANLTPLTDVAAKLTLQKVASGARASDAAAASNAQIASRLGIVGNLINQAIVDLTSAEAVNGASKDALEYNLRATATVAAALKDNATGTLEDALTTFVDQFINGGIADTETEDSPAITIEELLEEAQSILAEIKSVEGVDGDAEAISATGTSITNAEQAAAAGSTEQSQGEVPDDAGSTNIKAAKGIVKQIRDLASASVITQNQEAFVEELDLVTSAVEGEAGITAEALTLAASAFGAAYADYREAVENEMTPPDQVSIGEIDVNIEESEGSTKFSINQSLSVEDTNVEIELVVVDATVIDRQESTTEQSNVVDENIDFSLSASGSVTSANFQLFIAEGSNIEGKIVLTDTVTSLENSSESREIDSTLTDLSASLVFGIAQLTGDNPISFDGSLSMAIELASEVGEDIYSYDDFGGEQRQESQSDIHVEGAQLSLSGEFSDSEGVSLSASLTAGLTNFSESCEKFLTTHDDCDYGETESDFAMASLSINFSLDLSGVNDDIAVDFDVSRTGLETGKGSVKLSYSGKQLNLEYPGENAVNIANHNDALIILRETDDEARTLSGEITVSGVKYADISEESGTVVIRYTDGTFESAL